MSENEIYQRFIDWMKQTWWGMPETDVSLLLTKERYSPEEASFLTGIPFSLKKLEELAALKQMDPTELKTRLDALAKKGLVFRVIKDETVWYNLNDGFFVQRTTGWPGRTDEKNKALAHLSNLHYYHGSFDKYSYINTKGLRVLPVNSTIDDKRQILPYEDVAQVLDTQDYFCVTTCPCKHRKNLDPDYHDCKYPAEVCLHFGRLAHYIVENDLGREISRKETAEILQQCAEVGLVHAVSNMQKGVDTICNCCKCCCIWFEAFHKLKHLKSMDASNYRVHVNQGTCKGCTLCVQRCPMEALHMESSPIAQNKTGKVADLNPDLCIGCGICAYKCPSQSLVLVRREVVQDPPLDGREFLQRVMTDLQSVQARGTKVR